MLIISDTSVISNLAQIDQIQLLHSLYTEIIIPQKVDDELKASSATHEKIKDIKWIRVVAITDINLYTKLVLELDPGEAEAIVLAKELKANLLMIDEKKGRRIAKENGISIVGILGVLISAKQNGIISKVKPILDRMIYELGFRVNPALYQYVLKKVGE